jgi:hypothetical protein
MPERRSIAPVYGPNYWRARDMARSDEWIYLLNPDARSLIDSGLQHFRSTGLALEQAAKKDFPFGSFESELVRIRDEMEDGRGFVMIRGLDRQRYSKEDAAAIYWGMGLHLGTAIGQNAAGDLLGHVRNIDADMGNPNVRSYQTTADINFHNDSCDVVGLLCLNRSRSGGASRLANVLEIHNQILAERPDLLEVLYEPFYIDRRGERGRPDEPDEPFFKMPIFMFHAGKLSSRWTNYHYIESAQRFSEVPRMTELQREALRFLEEVSERPDMHFMMDFQPGDIQLINNYPIVHSRTAYDDFEEMDQRRHLLRLWLAVPNSRPLHPAFKQRWGAIEAGAIRGGAVGAARLEVTMR